MGSVAGGSFTRYLLTSETKHACGLWVGAGGLLAPWRAWTAETCCLLTVKSPTDADTTLC